MSKKLKTNLINKNKTRKNNKSLDDITNLSKDQINKISTNVGYDIRMISPDFGNA